MHLVPVFIATNYVKKRKKKPEASFVKQNKKSRSVSRIAHASLTGEDMCFI